MENCNKRQYAVCLEVDGESKFAICEARFWLATRPVLHIGGEEGKYAVMFYYDFLKENAGGVMALKSNNYEDIEIILKKIIDIGENDTSLEENGFVAIYNDDKTACEIHDTPDGKYIIPEKIEGVEVEKVKVTTSDLDFIWKSYFQSEDIILDISEVSADVEIPTEWLNTNSTIYVTPTVKEKYKSYANIKVKSD